MADMNARVLDVGQCDLDHANIKAMIEDNFHARVEALSSAEALEVMRRGRCDLILVNRELADGGDGLEMIRQAKREELTTPIMLVSDYADAQSAAVASGALPAFGKAALNDDATYERLARILPVKKVRATNVGP